jgi:hypothetical protein
LLTLTNFLLFLINVFIKIISRVIVFGILALSSFFIFFVIMVIVFSLGESGTSLGKSKDIFIFIHSIFMIITIMSVYLIFNHFKPFLAKIIKTMKTEINTKINIGNIVQKKGKKYENEIIYENQIINDKSLIKSFLFLKEIFNSIFATFKLTFIISLILTPFLILFIILSLFFIIMGSSSEANIFVEILMIIFKHMGIAILVKYFSYLIKVPLIFIIILIVFPIVLVFLLIKPTLVRNTILKIKNKVNDFKNIMLFNDVKSEEEQNKLIEEYVLFSLGNLLIWLFSGIISFGIYEYLADIYIYNLYVALFAHFLIVGFWSIAFHKEGW